MKDTEYKYSNTYCVSNHMFLWRRHKNGVPFYHNLDTPPEEVLEYMNKKNIDVCWVGEGNEDEDCETLDKAAPSIEREESLFYWICLYENLGDTFIFRRKKEGAFELSLKNMPISSLPPSEVIQFCKENNVDGCSVSGEIDKDTGRYKCESLKVFKPFDPGEVGR